MRLTLTSLTVATLLYATTTAVAEDLTGWCFPANDCTGEQSRIINNSFGTCEEECSLKNPERIKGMRAKFYDQYCDADGSSGAGKVKVIIAPSEGENGLELYYPS